MRGCGEVSCGTATICLPSIEARLEESPGMASTLSLPDIGVAARTVGISCRAKSIASTQRYQDT